VADYRFVTTWKLRAPIEDVWEALQHTERWPQWWKGVVSVTTLKPGGADRVGAVARFVWRSKLPYKLAFDMEVVRVEAPRFAEGRATGELEGSGVWRLDQVDGVTTAEYTWAVRTTAPWMNLLAPLARPAFAWNHDYVMARGAEGLARLLGVDLIAH
jgi:uncharacterized protein YndB with AHSA1/START domain